MILMQTVIKRSDEIGQAFQTFITKLEKNQVEYDLGSENIIKDMGSVSDGKLVVGQAAYSTVVIPPLVENLDLAYFSAAREICLRRWEVDTFSSPITA